MLNGHKVLGFELCSCQYFIVMMEKLHGADEKENWMRWEEQIKNVLRINLFKKESGPGICEKGIEFDHM